jgi:uncharacterized protein YdcH (DUF465 family)
MLDDIHDLIHEIPEHKERILQLKVSDKHFAKLYDEYNELDQQILRMEEGFETPSDDVLEEVKKKRLYLKDQLVGLIKNV